jgi:hypothetical protein
MEDNRRVLKNTLMPSDAVPAPSSKTCTSQPDSKYPRNNPSSTGGELGHSLGAFRHGVLGKLTRENKTNSSLDFPRRHSGFLVVACQVGGFSGDLIEDILHVAIIRGA